MDNFIVNDIRTLRRKYIGAQLDVERVEHDYLAFMNLKSGTFELSFTYLQTWDGEELTYDLSALIDLNGIITNIESVQCKRLSGDEILRSSYRNKKLDEYDYWRVDQKLKGLVSERQTRDIDYEEKMRWAARIRDSSGIEGLYFVLSGKPEKKSRGWETRQEIAQYLNENGAQVSQKVSKKVAFVVSLDDEEHAAEKKASELGIKILSSEIFDRLVGKSFESAEHITLPAWMKTIPPAALEQHHELASVTLPSGLRVISKEAFAVCTNLVEITIPESVTKIDSCAFNGCKELKRVILPDGLKEIGEYAFIGCEKLSEIEVPNGTSIGEGAFEKCNQLADSNGLIVVNDVLTNSSSRIEGLLEIPEGIRHIGNCAFLYAEKNELSPWSNRNGNGITHIHFSSNLISIGDKAFATCSQLTEVVLPEGLERLGHKVFCDSKRLSKVWIPASVTSMELDTFDEESFLIGTNHLNVTIYTPAGSYAEQYAKENRIRFTPCEREDFIERYEHSFLRTDQE